MLKDAVRIQHLIQRDCTWWLSQQVSFEFGDGTKIMPRLIGTYSTSSLYLVIIFKWDIYKI